MSDLFLPERRALTNLTKRRESFFLYWNGRAGGLARQNRDFPDIGERLQELVEFEELLATLWTRLQMDMRKGNVGQLKHTGTLANRWIQKVALPLTLAALLAEEGESIAEPVPFIMSREPEKPCEKHQ